MTRLSTFFPWRIGKTEAITGGTSIANTENYIPPITGKSLLIFTNQKILISGCVKLNDKSTCMGTLVWSSRSITSCRLHTKFCPVSSGRIFVMRSGEMSLKSGTIKFDFCNSVVKALGELCVNCWKSHQNQTYNSKDIDNFVQLKTIRCKRIFIPLLDISQNQYSRYTTHSAWSPHIFAYT